MTRTEKLFMELPKSIDCAIITSDVNRAYFTGMRSSAGTFLAFRDKAYLLIDFRYIEKARATVRDAEVIDPGKRLMPMIIELLKRHGAKNMAIESREMTVSRLNSLKKNIRGEVEIIDTDVLSNAIDSMRMVKDAEELACIRKAQEIAEIAFDSILRFIHPGVTERQIALELDRVMLENGAERVSFDTIALTGKNTSMPHGVPSETKVQEGDFVLMDYGAVYKGYHSDMTRTVCVGEPTEEMKRVYDIVLQAQAAAIDAARPGISGSELDFVARHIIEQAGYGENFGHSLGHGVGLEIHEAPNAAPKYSSKLKAGSVITVEPGIYLPGKFGVRIEDFVILTENGCINLTKCAKNIISL